MIERGARKPTGSTRPHHERMSPIVVAGDDGVIIDENDTERAIFKGFGIIEAVLADHLVGSPPWFYCSSAKSTVVSTSSPRNSMRSSTSLNRARDTFDPPMPCVMNVTTVSVR